jgi:NAD(P)-dependent dehydrogenase (short-subunit alcohol dehydrogenase family)
VRVRANLPIRRRRRGIGLAAAAALAEAGAQVTLAARTGREIEEAANAIRARGGEAEVLVLDVTDVEAARSAVAFVATPFQILVNNAGMNRPAYLPDVKVEDFDAIFALNVRAAFFIAQAVALRLIKTRLPGSIINISSQMGHVGAARRSVYCASKHAMEGFTKAMAIELAPHNIRVNSLGPTFIETPMTRPYFENKTFRDEVLSKIKLGRLGQLDEVTGAIVFLASDASTSLLLMTGVNYLTSTSSNPQNTAANTANPVPGTAFGSKSLIELYSTPTDKTMVEAEGSYSTAFGEYYEEFKIGYAALGPEIYIGPEAIFLGGQTYDQYRLGGFVSGIKIGKVELGFSGGYLKDRAQGSGYFVGTDFYARF